MNVHRLLLLMATSFAIIIKVISDNGTDKKAEAYLKFYGYLNDNTTITQAFESFQRDFKLDVTGTLDENTKIAMSKLGRPICALPKGKEPHPNPRTVRNYLAQQFPHPWIGTGDEFPWPLRTLEGRWYTRNLTYKFINDTIKTLTMEQIETAVMQAFDIWAQHIELTIQKVDGEKPADIEIRFYDQPMEETILGYAYLPERGDIFLARNYYWTVNEDEIIPDEKSEIKLSFKWLVLHEIGHALGLHHVADENSIMYDEYNAFVVMQPSLIDIQQLEENYYVSNKSLLCNSIATGSTMFRRVDGEYVVLISRYYWIFNQYGLRKGPYSLNYRWETVRTERFIDDAFSIGNKTFFFEGIFFHRYVNELSTGPKMFIQALDLFPREFMHLDAAFVYDDEVYMLKENKYWIFNMNKQMSDAMTTTDFFGDLPVGIDTAVAFDDKIMFVKGRYYYMFDMTEKKLAQRQDLYDLFHCDL